MTWTDGSSTYRAKYTQSSNSWSLLSTLPNATDPHVATTGGSNLPQQARHIYRATGSAPYALKTELGVIVQQPSLEGGEPQATYARRISVIDTISGAAFLVEFECPKVRNGRGQLRDLPFVTTNDTLLNLSLDSLGFYLQTEEGALAADSDSLILPFRVDSRNASALARAAAGGLRAMCRVEIPGQPNLSQEVLLHDFNHRAKRSARARMNIRALRGRNAHIKLELRGLNRQKRSLVPVLTHVHYFGEPEMTNDVVEVDAVTFGQTSPESEAALPREFALHQNYPNPFNPTTVIRYDLPQAAFVRLRIFNVKGQQVRELVAKRQAAGEYKVAWDSRDDTGLLVAAGTYFYRLEAAGFSDVKRLLLLK